MKLDWTTVAIAAALGAGSAYVLRGAEGLDVSAPAATAEGIVPDRTSATRGRAPASVNAEAVEVASPSISPAVPELEASARALRLEPAEAVVMRSTSVNALEGKLKLAVVAARHARELPGGESLGLHYLSDLKKNPVEGMRAIRSLSRKLVGKGFALDRAALLDLSLELEGQGPEAKALARETLNEVRIPAGRTPAEDASEEDLDEAALMPEETLVPIVAHSVLIRTSLGESEALAITIEAMLGQPNLSVRGALVAQFIERYPRGKARLLAAAEARKIQLPNVEDGTTGG